jgi:hypothetical protein
MKFEERYMAAFMWSQILQRRTLIRYPRGRRWLAWDRAASEAENTEDTVNFVGMAEAGSADIGRIAKQNPNGGLEARQ